jgi:hypothetical protein
MNNTLVVLSGVSLAAADVDVTAGNLQIKNSPVIKLSSVTNNNGVENHLNETVRVADFDITAANSTVYALNVTQQSPLNEQLLTNYLRYTSLASGDTATTICNKLVTTFNQQAAAIGMGVVASNSSDNLRLTATAATSVTTLGTPLFSASGNTNLPLLTGTSDAMYIAPDGTPATAFIVATLVFTSAAAHGLIPGDTVKVTSWATTVMTYKGATASATAGLIARVATVPSATTFTLEGLTASGVNTGTLVILKVPQVAMGTPAAVTAAQVAAGQVPSVSTTYNYGRCVIGFINSGPVVINPISGNNDLVVYWPNALVASAYTAQNANFTAKLLATTQGYTVGGTVANPDIIAINQNLTQ